MGDLPDGRRCVRNGGSAQLDRRVVQDLRRPLALPWGYTLAKGSRHEQSVSLSLFGRVDPDSKEVGGEATISLGADLSTRMPDLGVALPAQETKETLAAIASLRSMGPSFLVCSADLRDGLGLVKLDAYRQASEAVSARVVLEIVIPDEQDAAISLPPVAAAARNAGLNLGFSCCGKRRGPEILAAGCDASGEAGRRGDSQGGSHSVSRRPGRRRNALHLHGAQPETPEA